MKDYALNEILQFQPTELCNTKLLAELRVYKLERFADYYPETFLSTGMAYLNNDSLLTFSGDMKYDNSSMIIYLNSVDVSNTNFIEGVDIWDEPLFSYKEKRIGLPIPNIRLVIDSIQQRDDRFGTIELKYECEMFINPNAIRSIIIDYLNEEKEEFYTKTKKIDELLKNGL